MSQFIQEVAEELANLGHPVEEGFFVGSFEPDHIAKFEADGNSPEQVALLIADQLGL